MSSSTSGLPAQFSHQVTRLQFPKDVHFGDDISIWIAKAGDVALGNMYLRVTWPDVASTVDDSAGTRMIDFVELRYENSLLERHYGESLELMNDLSVPTAKQSVLTTLLGKGMTSNLEAYYIRMPFRLNLPLCALKKAPVFRVKFRTSQEFSNLNWTDPIQCDLFVDYVYVTKAERDYFKTATVDYLTHTIQRLQFTVDANQITSKFLTEFTRPVKELYWVIQTDGAAAYDFTNLGADQLVSLRLQFNGTDVILPEIGTPLFLHTIQGLESHTRVPDRRFYMYPFGLDPEHPDQPTGEVNMSAVTRQLHTLELSTCGISRQVRVYAVTHNVVRVTNGSAMSLFDSVQEGGTTTGGDKIFKYNTPNFANPGTQSFTNGGSLSVTQTTVNTGPLTWSISPTTGVTLTGASTSGVTVNVLYDVPIPTTSYTLTATNPSLVATSQTFSLTDTIVPLNFANPGTQTFTNGGSFSVTLTTLNTGPLTWSISPTTGVTLTGASTSGVTVNVLYDVPIPTTSYTLSVTNLSLVPTSQTFSLTNTIVPITYVATGSFGQTYRVMTSHDGITWTGQSTANFDLLSIAWNTVTWSGSQFVAVGDSDSTYNVMTSPDGITWTGRNQVSNDLNILSTSWYSVTWSGSQFVAVGYTGSTYRVMTSPDGITWTGRNQVSNDLNILSTSWYSVTWSGSQFVAVGDSDSTYRVMTSPDGITWTGRSTANFDLLSTQWYAVTWSGSQFVAVGDSDYTYNVMTSPDGITWTGRNQVSNDLNILSTEWYNVAWSGSQFVTVGGYSGSTYRVMTSPDGITWTGRNQVSNDLNILSTGWFGVTTAAI